MNLNSELVEKAMVATGIREKTALVHRGLEELIYRSAAERLIRLAGTQRKAVAAPRRKKIS